MCAVCTYIVTVAQLVVEDSVDAINYLKKVCTLFPEANQDPCISLVDTYITIIINMLTKGATPQMVCQKIWLCDYGRHGDVDVN